MNFSRPASAYERLLSALLILSIVLTISNGAAAALDLPRTSVPCANALARIASEAVVPALTEDLHSYSPRAAVKARQLSAPPMQVLPPRESPENSIESVQRRVDRIRERSVETWSQFPGLSAELLSRLKSTRIVVRKDEPAIKTVDGIATGAQGPTVVLNMAVAARLTDGGLAFLVGHSYGHVWQAPHELQLESLRAGNEGLLDTLALAREIEVRSNFLGFWVARRAGVANLDLMLGDFWTAVSEFHPIVGQNRDGQPLVPYWDESDLLFSEEGPELAAAALSRLTSLQLNFETLIADPATLSADEKKIVATQQRRLAVQLDRNYPVPLPFTPTEKEVQPIARLPAGLDILIDVSNRVAMRQKLFAHILFRWYGNWLANRQLRELHDQLKRERRLFPGTERLARFESRVRVWDKKLGVVDTPEGKAARRLWIRRDFTPAAEKSIWAIPMVGQIFAFMHLSSHPVPLLAGSLSILGAMWITVYRARKSGATWYRALAMGWLANAREHRRLNLEEDDWVSHNRLQKDDFGAVLAEFFQDRWVGGTAAGLVAVSALHFMALGPAILLQSSLREMLMVGGLIFFSTMGRLTWLAVEHLQEKGSNAPAANHFLASDRDSGLAEEKRDDSERVAPRLTPRDMYRAGTVRLRGGWWTFEFWRAAQWLRLNSQQKQIEAKVQLDTRALTPDEKARIETRIVPAWEKGYFWEQAAMKEFIKAHHFSPSEEREALRVGAAIGDAMITAAVPGFVQGASLALVVELALSALMWLYSPGSHTFIADFFQNPLLVFLPLGGGLLLAYRRGSRTAVDRLRENNSLPGTPKLTLRELQAHDSRWFKQELIFLTTLMQQPSAEPREFRRSLDEFLPAHQKLDELTPVQRILKEGLVEANEHGAFGRNGPEGHPFGFLLAFTLALLDAPVRQEVRKDLVAAWQKAITVYNQSPSRRAATGPLSPVLLLSFALSVLVAARDEGALLHLANGVLSLPERLRFQAAAFHLFQLGIHLGNNLGDERLDYALAGPLSKLVRMSLRDPLATYGSKEPLKTARTAILLSSDGIPEEFLKEIRPLSERVSDIALMKTADERDRTALVPLKRFTLVFGTEILALNRHFTKPADEILLDYWNPSNQQNLLAALRAEPGFAWDTDPGRGTRVGVLDKRYETIFGILTETRATNDRPEGLTPTGRRFLRQHA